MLKTYRHYLVKRLRTPKRRQESGKEALESKGLKVNAEKTKMMISSENVKKGYSRKQVSLYCLQKGS